MKYSAKVVIRTCACFKCNCEFTTDCNFCKLFVYFTAAGECHSAAHSPQFSTATLCLWLHSSSAQLSEGRVPGGRSPGHAHSLVPEPTWLAEGAHSTGCHQRPVEGHGGQQEISSLQQVTYCCDDPCPCTRRGVATLTIHNYFLSQLYYAVPSVLCYDT